MKQPSYYSLTALFVTGLILLAGCTGFESGPNVSLKATEKKMANTWKVKEAVFDNQEVSDLFEGDFMTFEEDGDYSTLDKGRLVSLPPFTQTDTIDVLGRGSWDFLGDKTQLELLFTYTFQDPIDSRTLYNEEVYEQWTIDRLTDEEFWLRTETKSMKLVPFEGN